MSAEFDTIAEWTARVAMDLGSDYRIPAACRGSGSPSALDWLLDRLGLAPGQSLLDCGAGVGGPAAYAVKKKSIRPILVEPEGGACRAARALFGHPVVQGSASELPIMDESFDAAWSLGVLCTMSDQPALLSELRRITRPGGRVGLLVFMARTSKELDSPAGNDFPTEDRLLGLVDDAGMNIETRRGTHGLPPTPPDWEEREQAVNDELNRRYADTQAWQLAERQGELIGRLLADHSVSGELLILRRPHS
jgi:SAM-dependent methyltransferase